MFPIVGDRVRVTRTGEVTSADPGKGTFSIVDDAGKNWSVDTLKEPVEYGPVAPPPPKTFQVGDTVRSLIDNSLYSIGVGGFFDHQSSQWFTTPAAFTSASFELVDL